jgi:hypothetical protein
MANSCETKPRTLKEYFRSWALWKVVIGMVIGGIAGFLYYHFVGCQSGTCAITSNPFSSVIFGSVMGMFLVAKPCSSC